MHVLPAFLISLLVHFHLTMLEPAIKDAIVIAKNPIVQKEVKAAVKKIAAGRHKRKQSAGG